MIQYFNSPRAQLNCRPAGRRGRSPDSQSLWPFAGMVQGHSRPNRDALSRTLTPAPLDTPPGLWSWPRAPLALTAAHPPSALGAHGPF